MYNLIPTTMVKQNESSVQDKVLAHVETMRNIICKSIKKNEVVKLVDSEIVAMLCDEKTIAHFTFKSIRKDNEGVVWVACHYKDINGTDEGDNERDLWSLSADELCEVAMGLTDR